MCHEYDYRKDGGCIHQPEAVPITSKLQVLFHKQMQIMTPLRFARWSSGEGEPPDTQVGRGNQDLRLKV